jgi:3-oxoacyl-[acyl-carrier-protein] synthase I
MTALPIAILNTGMVSSVGTTAAASCAAIRAKLTNPVETRFVNLSGEWIIAQSVKLDLPWRGTVKLARMASMAISECLSVLGRNDWGKIPLVLCIAERERPGRVGDMDSELFTAIQGQLGIEFSHHSMVLPLGRVGVGSALLHARRIIDEMHAPFVVIAATDSLLSSGTLRAYEQAERLLSPQNSNGFIPGEGAAALLVGHAERETDLVCTGVGFGTETSTIFDDSPLRGDGLHQSIKNALADAECDMRDVDFRITDLSGEQYYFKEAALALSRIMRVRKEEFDVWHPAECIGEVGAVSGVAMIVVAHAACLKGYAPGSGILCHAAADDGQRIAVVVRLPRQ